MMPVSLILSIAAHIFGRRWFLKRSGEDAPLVATLLQAGSLALGVIIGLMTYFLFYAHKVGMNSPL